MSFDKHMYVGHMPRTGIAVFYFFLKNNFSRDTKSLVYSTNIFGDF